MKEPFVFLCPEITREHALHLIRWLRNEEVRRYLSDLSSVSSGIENMMSTVQLPVLTHVFNHNGRFFIVCNRNHTPVGFARLVKKDIETEIVIAIGERAHWGKGLGTAAIFECLKTAFFEFRSQHVVAHIHPDNRRSVRAFIRAGFRLAAETPSMKSYVIDMGGYFRHVRQHAHATREIFITEIDRDRLSRLVSHMLSDDIGADHTVLDLRHELSRARIVQPRQVSHGIITMNSLVLLSLQGDEAVVSLVYPEDAVDTGQNVSVLSPVGAAILGYGEGAWIRWEFPTGTADIGIREVLYQPEAAGDYHL